MTSDFVDAAINGAIGVISGCIPPINPTDPECFHMLVGPSILLLKIGQFIQDIIVFVEILNCLASTRVFSIYIRKAFNFTANCILFFSRFFRGEGEGGIYSSFDLLIFLEKGMLITWLVLSMAQN